MNSHDFGAVAQLGERLPCTQEVRSSILLGSTIFEVHSSSFFEDPGSHNQAVVRRLFASDFFVSAALNGVGKLFNNLGNEKVQVFLMEYKR